MASRAKSSGDSPTQHSVNEEFLSQFSDDELTRYLTRLGFTEGRRFEWQSDADAFVDGAFGYRRASA